jgi:hypothetical protein
LKEKKRKKRNHRKRYLAIQGCGIVASPKEREQIGVGANLRVELDTHHLHVVGGSGAHQLVVRIRVVTLGVPNLRPHHPDDSLKRQLHSPEAPGSELGELVTRIVRSIRIWIKSRVVVVADVVRNGSHSSTLPVSIDQREGDLYNI